MKSPKWICVNWSCPDFDRKPGTTSSEQRTPNCAKCGLALREVDPAFVASLQYRRYVLGMMGFLLTGLVLASSMVALDRGSKIFSDSPPSNGRAVLPDTQENGRLPVNETAVIHDYIRLGYQRAFDLLNLIHLALNLKKVADLPSSLEDGVRQRYETILAGKRADLFFALGQYQLALRTLSKYDRESVASVLKTMSGDFEHSEEVGRKAVELFQTHAADYFNGRLHVDDTNRLMSDFFSALNSNGSLEISR